MASFITKLIVYLICFILSLIGLSAFDFNRVLKPNKVVEAWILYYIIAFVLTYILGQFIISIMYFMN